MSIWSYESTPFVIDESICSSEVCIFCNVRLKGHFVDTSVNYKVRSLHIEHCQQCGWWKGEYVFDDSEYRMRTRYYKYGYGVLKSLDIKDLKTPIDEIRDYLTVRNEEVKNINPQLMEEVVGSVFRGLGYHVVVTNYSGDFGIDVVLHDASSKMIGVQVKRYKNKIEANDIRAFTGALVLGGYTKGIFITTSDYRSGAINVAESAAAIGVPIQLMNYKDFFAALSISQAKVPRDKMRFEDYNIDHFRLFNYYSLDDDERYY